VGYLTTVEGGVGGGGGKEGTQIRFRIVGETNIKYEGKILQTRKKVI